MTAKNIVIYSTPTCPYCVYVKDFFHDRGIPFVDKDVSRDQGAGQEMVKKSGQMGVPVIDIDGHIIVGFQPDAFTALLQN